MFPREGCLNENFNKTLRGVCRVLLFYESRFCASEEECLIRSSGTFASEFYVDVRPDLGRADFGQR